MDLFCGFLTLLSVCAYFNRGSAGLRRNGRGRGSVGFGISITHNIPLKCTEHLPMLCELCPSHAMLCCVSYCAYGCDAQVKRAKEMMAGGPLPEESSDDEGGPGDGSGIPMVSRVGQYRFRSTG